MTSSATARAVQPGRSPDRRTRVLAIVHDGQITGASISLRNVLREVDPSRYEVRVLLGEDGPVRRVFEELGVPVDHVPIRRFSTTPTPRWFDWDYANNWLALRPNRPLREYLQRVQPDIVHVNEKSSLIAGVTAARLGLPVIWHLRGTYQGWRSWTQMALSRRLIRRTAAAMIAISEDETDGFEDFPHLHVIYNGVDLGAVEAARVRRAAIRAEFGVGDDEIVFCKVGVLTEPKGAWNFIRAAGIARRRRPDLKLRFLIMAPIPGRVPVDYGIRGRLGLVDTTHPEDRARALARECGVDDVLTLTGRRSDAYAVMAGSDIVVAVYRLWAMGRAAFEGMAVGRPVIVNEGHSGRSGVVRHEETGVLVPPAEPEVLAEAMIRLAEDPALRERLAAAGLRKARERFDARANAQAVARVYDQVAQQIPPATRGTGA